MPVRKEHKGLTKTAQELIRTCMRAFSRNRKKCQLLMTFVMYFQVDISISFGDHAEPDIP